MLSLTFATGKRAKRSTTSAPIFLCRFNTLNPAANNPSHNFDLLHYRTSFHFGQDGRLGTAHR
ncbi:MAG: hypothetical protein ABWY82_20515, partial [Tardiphaga sp.]